MELTGLAGLGTAAVVLAVVAVLGWRLRRQGARVRPVPPEPAGWPLADLGVAPGPVTLLQFSSAFCAPCRATRVRCGQLAAALPGVRHVEVDAEHHLDAVRALRVWRTPTVLVVDAGGRIVARVTGPPTRDQLAGVVTSLLAPAVRR